MDMQKVGVVIPVHNSRQRLQECLTELLANSHPNLYVVVVDDGSTDGAAEMLREHFPSVHIEHGDGNLWWTGSTNLGIKKCLESGCEFILLLNHDSIINPDAISLLVQHAQTAPDTIFASVVVDYAHPKIIWWAGAKWQPVKPWLPLWLFIYLYKSGCSVNVLPKEPLATDDVHGRCVLIPRSIFEAIGLYDEKVFPHYGADNDFSLRTRKAGFKILIVTQVHTRLFTQDTGIQSAQRLRDLPYKYWKFLFDRKTSEFARTSWHLLRRHAPWYSVIPSYIFWLLFASYRFLALTSMSWIWLLCWCVDWG